jgi:hypothetical protein
VSCTHGLPRAADPPAVGPADAGLPLKVAQRHLAYAVYAGLYGEGSGEIV